MPTKINFLRTIYIFKIYQQLKDASDDLDASNRLANVEIQSILEKSKLEIEKIDKQSNKDIL